MLRIPVSSIEARKAGRSAATYDKERKKMRTKSLAGVLMALFLIVGAARSVAQVMEHIAAAEDFIREMVKEKLMTAPAGEPGRDVKKTDDAVLAMVPDRTNKAQAPEPLVPTNRFGSAEGSVKHFVESRAATEDFLKTAPGLRDHVADSPLGKLDGYEFVLFIAAHSERHTKQINEVKADPNFPKK